MAEFVIEPRAGCVDASRLVRQLGLCVLEARPVVQVIYLLRFVAGYALAGPGTVTPAWRPIAGALCWLLATGSVYLFDGVMDVAEDRLNGSRRPIARGALPREFALGVSLLWAGLGFAGALMLGGPYRWLLPALLLLGYAYSAPPARLKRWSWSSGVTVLAAGLMTFAVGGSAGGTWGGPALVLFALGMSGWMGLVGALAKDFTDVYGDAAVGRRTSVVVRGVRRTAVRLSVNAVCVALGFLLAAWLLAPVLLGPGVVLALGAAGVLLSCARPAVRRRCRPYRAFMLTQYAAHGVVLAVALAQLAS